jgi:hypothetical protein
MNEPVYGKVEPNVDQNESADKLSALDWFEIGKQGTKNFIFISILMGTLVVSHIVMTFLTKVKSRIYIQ